MKTAGSITIIYTKRKWNVFSWLIRWALPRSRFCIALSSHCMIKFNDYVYEATMFKGVRYVPRTVAMVGATEVTSITYTVPNEEAGYAWLRKQVNKPYDWSGALGLGLAPNRNWSEEDSWFCYELAGATLRACGRDEFTALQHLNETALMAVKP